MIHNVAPSSKEKYLNLSKFEMVVVGKWPLADPVQRNNETGTTLENGEMQFEIVLGYIDPI